MDVWKSKPSTAPAAHHHYPGQHLHQHHQQQQQQHHHQQHDGGCPDFRPTLNIWRERLPNKWDKLNMWHDILAWRTDVFQQVSFGLNWFETDSDRQHRLHDAPWTAIKLAHVSRKQRAAPAALSALASLQDCKLTAADAFERLREQILMCAVHQNHYLPAVNMINSVNLEHFDAQQTAEVLRLKALFLSKYAKHSDGEAQGRFSKEAQIEYSNALQICGNYGKAWYSWALFSDEAYKAQKTLNSAAQTITCYLKAILHNSDGARLMLARVLWLLSSCEDDYLQLA
eukprot:7846-Heterococcus_DN1.PRE.1